MFEGGAFRRSLNVLYLPGWDAGTAFPEGRPLSRQVSWGTVVVFDSEGPRCAPSPAQNGRTYRQVSRAIRLRPEAADHGGAVRVTTIAANRDATRTGDVPISAIQRRRRFGRRHCDGGRGEAARPRPRASTKTTGPATARPRSLPATMPIAAMRTPNSTPRVNVVIPVNLPRDTCP